MMYCRHCGNSCNDVFGRYMRNDGKTCNGPREPYCEPSEQDITRAAYERAQDHVFELTAALYEAQENALAAQERYHLANQAFLDSEKKQ